MTGTSAHSCRACGSAVATLVVDLGMTPLANCYTDGNELDASETFHPLRAYVCEECFLMQLRSVSKPEAIFSEYAYFSSYSDSWLEHARRYAETMARRLDLGPDSLVVEVASNDGYLLQYFAAAEIPILGVEPARNVAAAAELAGIPTLVRFFGRETGTEIASSLGLADLVVANNVLAHVPDLPDFVGGLAVVLKPSGVLTIEVPHVLRLLEECQFDTIYHEHLSYFSLATIERVLEPRGLAVVDVEEIPTHGGSLRVYARHANGGDVRASPAVDELRSRERASGLFVLATYKTFAERVRTVKRDLLSFLIEERRLGRSVVAYGAAAKGMTLLNYCGIRSDLVDYVVDRSLYKQGRFTPGTRVPIYPPERIAETRPACILILPWNLQAEVIEQLRESLGFEGRFVVPIPALQIIAAEGG